MFSFPWFYNKCRACGLGDPLRPTQWHVNQARNTTLYTRGWLRCEQVKTRKPWEVKWWSIFWYALPELVWPNKYKSDLVYLWMPRGGGILKEGFGGLESEAPARRSRIRGPTFSSFPWGSYWSSCRSQTAWPQEPALLIICAVTLGKSLNLSEPPWAHLLSENKSSTYTRVIVKVERREPNAYHIVDAQHVVVLLVFCAAAWKSQAPDTSPSAPPTPNSSRQECAEHRGHVTAAPPCRKPRYELSLRTAGWWLRQPRSQAWPHFNRERERLRKAGQDSGVNGKSERK